MQIYVIENNGIYKIGISYNARARLQMLGISKSAKIVLCEELERAKFCERILHNVFHHKHVRLNKKRDGSTEWFNLNNEDLYTAKTIISEFKNNGPEILLKYIEYNGPRQLH